MTPNRVTATSRGRNQGCQRRAHAGNRHPTGQPPRNAGSEAGLKRDLGAAQVARRAIVANPTRICRRARNHHLIRNHRLARTPNAHLARHSPNSRRGVRQGKRNAPAPKFGAGALVWRRPERAGRRLRSISDPTYRRSGRARTPCGRAPDGGGRSRPWARHRPLPSRAFRGPTRFLPRRAPGRG